MTCPDVTVHFTARISWLATSKDSKQASSWLAIVLSVSDQDDAASVSLLMAPSFRTAARLQMLTHLRVVPRDRHLFRRSKPPPP